MILSWKRPAPDGKGRPVRRSACGRFAIIKQNGGWLLERLHRTTDYGFGWVEHERLGDFDRLSDAKEAAEDHV